jgi:hypothetical protein
MKKNQYKTYHLPVVLYGISGFVASATTHDVIML